jgi:hypothetical protein
MDNEFKLPSALIRINILKEWMMCRASKD